MVLERSHSASGSPQVTAQMGQTGEVSRGSSIVRNPWFLARAGDGARVVARHDRRGGAEAGAAHAEADRAVRSGLVPSISPTTKQSLRIESVQCPPLWTSWRTSASRASGCEFSRRTEHSSQQYRTLCCFSGAWISFVHASWSTSARAEADGLHIQNPGFALASVTACGVRSVFTFSSRSQNRVTVGGAVGVRQVLSFGGGPPGNAYGISAARSSRGDWGVLRVPSARHELVRFWLHSCVAQGVCLTQGTRQFGETDSGGPLRNLRGGGDGCWSWNERIGGVGRGCACGGPEAS